MPSLEPYSKKSEYSYCLGSYPCKLLLEYRPKSVFRLLLGEGARGEGVEALRCKCAGLGIREEAAQKVLRRESGKDNCFVGMAFRKYQSKLLPEKPHAVFNAISDSGNLGTALRSAAAFGYDDVALIRPCADVFEPHTLRASMGAFFLLRVHVYDSFDEYASEFKGRAMYPFMLDGAKDLDVVAAGAPASHSLIFGNEATGLGSEFHSYGQSVKIPQSDRIDSLNLSVAASVAMYAFSTGSKQR